ncbi:MAG: DUF5123 domain-containing protein [Paludibacter sp.]|nr:DUF5123 domain-containing protein [Paludibacter sp.]
MKKIFYKLILMVVAVTTCSAILSGCSDDLLPGATRLFRPIIASDNIVAGLDVDTVPYIKLKWDKYADANQYVVKVIASDGTDSATITTDSVSCIFLNLKFDKEYNIKIHSVNTTKKLESKDYVTNVITPDFPTQLVNISASNIIDTQVRIGWNTTENGKATVFDTIRVYNVTNDSLEVSSPVASDELTSGQKIIRKLHPSTKYRVEAYKSGKFKGKKLFTTTSAENYSGLVIDLRGLTATDSYKYFSVVSGSLYANSVDSIVKANPDQNITFVLQGGVTYRMPTLVLPATTGKIKFATGLSLNGKASFAVSGNFNAAAGTIIGGLEFQKIFFTDAPLEGKGRGVGDLNYGGTYLFNFSGADSEIKGIKISDCTIKYKRGILRCQTAAVTVDTIRIDNCIIDSIGGYGVINTDVATSKITNITVTNSTLSSCAVLFSGAKQFASPINSIDIENNTFVYCISNGKYIFDYNGCTVSSFILKNCVFGIGGKNPAEVLTTGIKGWSGTVVPTADGCYFTSDYLWVLTTGTTTPAAQIPGITLTTNTAQTFEDPTKSNFKVISTELKKVKAGDPRWY